MMSEKSENLDGVFIYNDNNLFGLYINDFFFIHVGITFSNHTHCHIYSATLNLNL